MLHYSSFPNLVLVSFVLVMFGRVCSESFYVESSNASYSPLPSLTVSPQTTANSDSTTPEGTSSTVKLTTRASTKSSETTITTTATKVVSTTTMQTKVEPETFASTERSTIMTSAAVSTSEVPTTTISTSVSTTKAETTGSTTATATSTTATTPKGTNKPTTSPTSPQPKPMTTKMAGTSASSLTTEEVSSKPLFIPKKLEEGSDTVVSSNDTQLYNDEEQSVPRGTASRPNILSSTMLILLLHSAIVIFLSGLLIE